ncbi:MAG TPA: SURF1 family protein [Propionibacteriaceae bacterium]|nr:SURF1 family protein [Propionibacteriaceae bacterium]
MVDSRPRSRWVPGLIVSVGVLAALVMGALGLWQAQVFVDQGKTAAAAITGEPVQRLDATVTGDGVGALWGHTVSVQGHYLPSQQVLVVGADGRGRVVTAFALADGRVVAIARGVGTGSEPPPSGELTQTGVFLPTEAAADRTVPPGTYGSVRLQALAQVWPQPLVAGYVTLGADEAAAQGLAPAPVVLPTLEGKERNAGYALQWWAFAAFALVMSVLVARNYRRRGLSLSDGD